MEQRGYSLIRNDGVPSSGRLAAFAVIALVILCSSTLLPLWLSDRDGNYASAAFSGPTASDWVTIVYRILVNLVAFSGFMRAFSIPSSWPPKSQGIPALVAMIAGTSEEQVVEFADAAIELPNGPEIYQAFVILARIDQVRWAALGGGTLYTFFIPRGEAYMVFLAAALAFSYAALAVLYPVVAPTKYVYAVSTNSKLLAAHVIFAVLGWFSFYVYYKDAMALHQFSYDISGSRSITEWVTIAYLLVVNLVAFSGFMRAFRIPTGLPLSSIGVPLPVAMITNQSEDEVEEFSKTVIDLPNGAEIYQAFVTLGRTAQTALAALSTALTCAFFINYADAYAVFLMLAQAWTFSALAHLQALMAPTKTVYAISSSTKWATLNLILAGFGWFSFYVSKFMF